LAGLLISSTFAVFYLFQYNHAQSNANVYLTELKSVVPTQDTKILIDFGNGTLRWSNDTQVPTGANTYVATVIATHGAVNATLYPPLTPGQSAEHFVTGIYNVPQTPQKSWFIWTYNDTARWQVAQVGPDALVASNGSIFAWTFCGYNAQTYVPSCTP
jgi:hypothetical protein